MLFFLLQLQNDVKTYVFTTLSCYGKCANDVVIEMGITSDDNFALQNDYFLCRKDEYVKYAYFHLSTIT